MIDGSDVAFVVVVVTSRRDGETDDDAEGMRDRQTSEAEVERTGCWSPQYACRI